MKQTFTCPIDDMRESTIESAKRRIYSVATEMGFPYHRDPVVKNAQDGKVYIDWDFYTSSNEVFEGIAGM